MKTLITFGLLAFVICAAQAGTPTTKSLSAPTDATPAETDKTEELAKLAQNPVVNLISVPLQWNMGFGAGPTSTYQSTLNIQPVIPITINEDWNIITRTILPVDINGYEVTLHNVRNCDYRTNTDHPPVGDSHRAPLADHRGNDV